MYESDTLLFVIPTAKPTLWNKNLDMTWHDLYLHVCHLYLFDSQYTVNQAPITKDGFLFFSLFARFLSRKNGMAL